MKNIVLACLLFVCGTAFAAPTPLYHVVTREDCSRGDSIIYSAITVRGQVSYDEVLLALVQDEHLKLDGYKAMLPMTVKYIGRVFFNNLQNTHEFQEKCSEKIGHSLPYFL